MTFKSETPTGDYVPVASVGVLPTKVLLAAVGLCCVALLAAITIWPIEASAFNQEGGVIETVSAAGLFVAGIAAFYRFPGVRRLYIGLVCLLLAERELEASIYTTGSVPFVILDGLDIILDVTLVRILLAVLVLGGIVTHGIPCGWRALKLRAPFLLVFVLAGTAAVVAQLLEEMAGFYGASLSLTMATRLFVLEETLEMFFSIGLLASVLIGWPKLLTEETKDEPNRNPIADPR